MLLACILVKLYLVDAKLKYQDTFLPVLTFLKSVKLSARTATIEAVRARDSHYWPNYFFTDKSMLVDIMTAIIGPFGFLYW